MERTPNNPEQTAELRDDDVAKIVNQFRARLPLLGAEKLMDFNDDATRFFDNLKAKFTGEVLRKFKAIHVLIGSTWGTNNEPSAAEVDIEVRQEILKQIMDQVAKWKSKYGINDGSPERS